MKTTYNCATDSVSDSNLRSRYVDSQTVPFMEIIWVEQEKKAKSKCTLDTNVLSKNILLRSELGT